MSPLLDPIRISPLIECEALKRCYAWLWTKLIQSVGTPCINLLRSHGMESLICAFYIQQIQDSVQEAIAKPLFWRSKLSVSTFQYYYMNMSYCTITLSPTKWCNSSPTGEEGFSFIFFWFFFFCKCDEHAIDVLVVKILKQHLGKPGVFCVSSALQIVKKGPNPKHFVDCQLFCLF